MARNVLDKRQTGGRAAVFVIGVRGAPSVTPTWGGTSRGAREQRPEAAGAMTTPEGIRVREDTANGRPGPSGRNQSHASHLRPSNMSLIWIRVSDNRTLAHGAVASATRDEAVIAAIGA